MVRSSIHLVGGGPGTLGALRRHLASALRQVQPSGKRSAPLVAYVGAASGDDAGFQRMVGAEIERAGGRLRAAKLASPRAKLSAARAVLEGCDVVFVSGGDVEAGMRVLEERGAMPIFRALGEAARPMIGISAGSIMLGRAWIRFPEEAAPEVFPCMDLAPVHVDAHAEEDRWAELRVLLLALSLASPATASSPVGYGLTRQGGIRIEPDGRGVKILAFGTPAPRFVVRHGRVVAARPLGLARPRAARAR